MSAEYQAAAATDPGQRPYNEDAYLIAESTGLFVVADGVGGREAGEVASKLACEVMQASTEAGRLLVDAVGDAHREIRAAIEARGDSENNAMASTIVALQLVNNGFCMAWTGDSRGYLWEDGRLWGLTRDHSLVEELIARGEITREQARDHPQQNVILSALGGESHELEIGSNRGRIPSQGTFLLCSDGLTDALTLNEICAVLASGKSVQERAGALADLARENGGRDNITVLLLDTRGADGASGRAPDIYELFDPGSGEHSWSTPSPETTETVAQARRPAAQALADELELPPARPKAAKTAQSGGSTMGAVLMAVAALVVAITLGALVLGLM